MSAPDYYKTLGVGKKATADEIKKAYRKLALKWHPDRVKGDEKEAAEKKFKEIGEAFEVLSDPEKRKTYDVGGFDPMGGMGGGNGGGGGGPPPGFSFGGGGPGGGGPGARSFPFGGGGDPHDIFQAFFGSSDASAFNSDEDEGSPFGGGGMGGGFPGMMGGGGGGGMPFMMGGQGMPGGMGGRGGGMGQQQQQQRQQQAPKKKADPVNYDLNVSLEDLYGGTTKKMRITKKIMDGGSGRQTSVSNEKQISVKAGWKDGTKITYNNEGDEAPGIIPADIIFTVKAKPHDRFERDRDQLLYTCPVTLREAICGVSKSVRSLDGRNVKIEAHHVTPETVLTIPNEGMPNSKSGVKGDLKVKFLIRFPEFNDADRDELGSMLGRMERK
jgi:DnaJ homolog subfamily B member 4